MLSIAQTVHGSVAFDSLKDPSWHPKLSSCGGHILLSCTLCWHSFPTLTITGLSTHGFVLLPMQLLKGGDHDTDTASAVHVPQWPMTHPFQQA